MDNNIVIVKKDDSYMMCHLVDNKMTHFYAFDSIESEELNIGSIVNGRVEKRLDNANGSFIRIGKNISAYINKSIKPETVLPIMIKKEALGDKRCLVTDKLSISGEYVVISEVKSNNNGGIKVSSKLSDKKAHRLKERYSELINGYSFECLFRTKAGDYINTDNIESSTDAIRNEIIELCEKLKYIKEQGANRPSYFVFYKPANALITNMLQYINEGAKEVITDCQDIYDYLNEYISPLNKKLTDHISIRKYEDKLLPLYKLYSFEGKISELLSRKIYLKNGATIYIDKTEALTAIDVNSASIKLKLNDKDNALLNVNLLALEEIVRQIILRNISGIIIIDFINMNNSADYEILASRIKEFFKKDKNNVCFHGFTALGLAEISRQRKGLDVKEMLNK